MNKTVILAIRGEIKLDICLEHAHKFVEEMYADASTMMDLRLITAKQYLELVNKTKAVENEIGRERARQKRTVSKARESGRMDADGAAKEEKGQR